MLSLIKKMNDNLLTAFPEKTKRIKQKEEQDV